MVSQALWLGLLATLVDLALSACGGEKQQELGPTPTGERESPAPLLDGVFSVYIPRFGAGS
jgi:hypothetical protein